VSCDVAVVGAGISGAIVAEQLTRSGRKVVALDRRDVAQGSTSASTSLLQYEIDVMLVDLSRRIGRAAAERAYVLSYQAIDQLSELAARLPNDCGFEHKLSLYVASNPLDAHKLEAEAAARRGCGFNVRLVSEPELRATYGLRYPAAIVSTQAASVDAYRMAHSLLQLTCAGGGEVFDRTAVIGYEPHAGGTRLRTDRGPIVEAQHVVIATGYEAQHMLREKVVNLKSTYAVVTQPLQSLEPWNQDWILWETKRPYLYLRAAPENRFLAGGEDDDFYDPARRDRSLPEKSLRLLEQLRHLFPGLDLEVQHSWAGTFGETKDGLAYIGPSPEYPNCLFALGFGGNGITFSCIAADLICKSLDRQSVPDLDLFRFGR
jgi:glycine/D-amino acid oxidase-like deaminating enzyme